MSFESVYRSREGTREINKISNFIGQLVIKNEYEAKAAETTNSVTEYYKYSGAYTKHDNIDDYSLSDRSDYHSVVTVSMTSRGYKKEVIDNLRLKTNDFLKENRTVQVIKDYLTALRVARIYYYDERNTYYRQFLGLPNSDDDVINIKNLDNESSVEYIPIHKVTEKNYPETYTYYFLQDNIQTLIDKYPTLNYLRFINSSYTPYYLRNLQNYAIIKYPTGVLDSTELSYFMKSYNRARTQILLDYIDGFDSKQPLYNVLMIENLLYYTIINYSASYIERFTLCDYTNENVDHILKSYGYDNLTKIDDTDLKKRIVKNLNDLIANKANNYILNLILNQIIQVEGNELKRYYVEKQYNVDENLAISIDTGKSLENSVSLTLRETNAISTNELSTTDDTYRDYDSFVGSDNLWGGINDTDSQSTIEEKKEKLKKEILKLNFNSILTRYITLTRTVDILESQRNLRDSLYVMLKYFENNDSQIFFTTPVSFETFECPPAAMFAALCWLQQMKFYDNPDTIIKNQMLINSTAVFRTFGKSITDADSFERTYIKNGKVTNTFDITPDILEWNVVDFFKKDDEISTVQIGKILNYDTVSADGLKHVVDEKEDITDYINVYRFYENGVQLGDVTINTTFKELITDYRNQYPNLIKRITLKLRNSYDFNQYQAWLYLLNQSRQDNSIYGIFKNADTFSGYIKDVCESSELVTWIKNEVIDKTTGKPNFQKVCDTITIVSEYFKNWVNDSFSSLVYEYEMDNDADNYVSDMIILFNEFLSTYSELYSVDYKYTFGSLSWDGDTVQLFYNPLYYHFHDQYNEKLDLKYKQYSSLLAQYNENLKLDYLQTIHINDSFVDSINNELITDPETKEYKSIAFLYKESVKLGEEIFDLMNLKEKISTKVQLGFSDNIIIRESLKINDNSTD